MTVNKINHQVSFIPKDPENKKEQKIKIDKFRRSFLLKNVTQIKEEDPKDALVQALCENLRNLTLLQELKTEIENFTGSGARYDLLSSFKEMLTVIKENDQILRGGLEIKEIQENQEWKELNEKLNILEDFYDKTTKAVLKREAWQEEREAMEVAEGHLPDPKWIILSSNIARLSSQGVLKYFLDLEEKINTLENKSNNKTKEYIKQIKPGIISAFDQKLQLDPNNLEASFKNLGNEYKEKMRKEHESRFGTDYKEEDFEKKLKNAQPTNLLLYGTLEDFLEKSEVFSKDYVKLIETVCKEHMQKVIRRFFSNS